MSWSAFRTAGTVVLALTVIVEPRLAAARNLQIVLPTHYAGDSKRLEDEMWRVFESIEPGDRYVVLNGTTNERIASIEVPPKDGYKRVARKARHFARENATIGKVLLSYGKGEGTGASKLDLLGVLRALGDDREDRDSERDVLMLGTPVQETRTASFSMVDASGRLRVPSDGHVTAMPKISPYGAGGRAGMLRGVSVHFCVTDTESWTSMERAAVRRFWQLWIEYQGGVVATWTADIATCFERFRKRAHNGVPVEPLRDREPLAMNYVTAEGARTSAQPTDILPDLLNEFRKVNHPTLDGVIVYTGVEYKKTEYPDRYVNAWCYFHMLSKRGVQVRVDVGNKEPGSPAAWEEPAAETLRAIGISRTDVSAARPMCRFPSDPS